ncbi:MAG: ImmA/IrrE family metallo-endopeptidase [Candidatus Moranbacteria bacterium]|nr:ImmA/IrrE family metallo-endopeptidase [Candidatus Moranbacteria bacterium]
MEENDVTSGARKTVAKKLALKLLSDAGITAAPVQLPQIIRFLQETRNLEVVSSPFPISISGLLVRCNDLDMESLTIGFNQNEPWCRRRFTIAHEIGHILMNHASCDRGNETSHKETEANVFASELLLPTKILKEDFSKIQNIPELSKKYLVSQLAMGIKLSQGSFLK